MCIIVAKKRNSAIPNFETLERCFEHNNDGAGISWCEKGAVHIRKGFMTYIDI